MTVSAQLFQSFAPIMSQLASGFLAMEHGDLKLEFETRTVSSGCILVVALTRREENAHALAQRSTSYEWEVGVFWSWFETPPILHLSDGARIVDPEQIAQAIMGEIRIIVGIENPKLTAE